MKRGLLCSAGRITCSVSHDGSVYPCTFFNTPLGNINSTSLKVIWDNSHFLKLIRSIKVENFEKCNNCEINEYCNVCLVTNINEIGNVFIPSKEYCASKLSKWRNYNE